MLHLIPGICFIAFLLTAITSAQNPPADQATAVGTETAHPMRVYDEKLVAQHRRSAIQPVRLGNRPPEYDHGGPITRLQVRVEVDEKGDVISASRPPAKAITGFPNWPHTSPMILLSAQEARDRTAIYYNAVLAQARTWKYMPFLRNGKPVHANFEEEVEVLPLEEPPTAHLPFPPVQNWDSVKMVWEREPHGRFRLEIFGDGTVVYKGYKEVLIKGEHRDHISRDAVSELVQAFRQADYFSLRSEYVYHGWKKRSEEITSISFDGHRKSVKEHYGEAVGMPHAVNELEDTIERVSGAKKWLLGSVDTVSSLKREGFDFTSPEAGKVLFDLASDNDTPVDVLRDFLAAGVPTATPKDYRKCGPSMCRQECLLAKVAWRKDLKLLQMAIEAGGDYGDPQCTNDALELAAVVGDLDAVRTLIQYRGKPPEPEIGQLLLRSATSGNPELVAEILKYHPNLNNADILVFGVLSHADLVVLSHEIGDASDEDHDKQTRPREQITRMLLKAGADPNLKDREGNTALYYADWTSSARALIEAGADVNARNNDGYTPLMRNTSPEVVKVLIDSGADLLATNKDGDTALGALQKIKHTPCQPDPFAECEPGLSAEQKQKLALLEAATSRKMPETAPK